MSRFYIGLSNTLHDTSIAIVDADGELLFAEATERYLQNKRAVNIMPDVVFRTANLLRCYCGDATELVVAYSWTAGMEAELRAAADTRPSDSAIERVIGEIPRQLRTGIARHAWLTQSQLRALSFAGKTLEYELHELDHAPTLIANRYYNHHLTHATAACFASPYDEAVCVVMDGVGEGGAYSVYRYENLQLHPIDLGPPPAGTPASLGVFYSELCEACGFSSLAGEEWKVMGLAPYGRFNPDLYHLLKCLIRVEGAHLVSPIPGRQLVMLNRLAKLQRPKDSSPMAASDLAFSGQKVFCETLFSFLCQVHQLAQSENLILTGGCALNSSANGRILGNTPFKRLFVPSAPGDDGNSVGAAILAYRDDHPNGRPGPQISSAYLGSIMSNETLEHIRKFGGFQKVSQCGPRAPHRAAELLAEGKVVGWIQGPAEFGPRALGNRSILADPRSRSIKDVINSRIKFREEFRPFAPSILHEYGASYFIDYQESPYMERTLQFRPDVIDKVPGVVHEDGTGRLQSVKREWNAPFYDLISCFYSLTGIPLVLNTSFNVMGKPISHSVEDVISVYCTSGIDAVCIGDTLIEKR